MKSKLTELLRPISNLASHSRRSILVKKAFVGSIPLFTVLCFLVFVNPRISFDGWQYLTSARAIKDDQMAEWYFWVRQPIYPFTISLISKITNSLWVLFVFQYVLVYFSFWYFSRQLAKKFSLKRDSAPVFCNLIFLFWTLFLGGYAAAVMKESFFTAFFLIFYATILRIYYQIQEPLEIGKKRRRIIFDYSFLVILVPLGYFISSELGIFVVITAFLLSTIAIFKERKKNRFKIKIQSISNLIIVACMLLALLICSNIWSNTTSLAIVNPNFNQQNYEDPMWNNKLIDILSSYKNNTEQLQQIPANFLSLFMIIPNQGWSLDTYANSREANHDLSSQNGDVGFGLMSDHYPNCEITSPHNFMSSKEFLGNFMSYGRCALTPYNLPTEFFYLLFLLWVFCFIYWSRLLLLGRDKKIAMLSIPILSYTGIIAIAGGGIDRYGSICYLSIISLAVFSFLENLQANAKNE